MQSVPGSLATAESVAKDLCISSARQAHKLQCFCPKTLTEERNSDARSNFSFFKSLSLPHLQATSSRLWSSSVGISLDHFLNTWAISVFTSFTYPYQPRGWILLLYFSQIVWKTVITLHGNQPASTSFLLSFPYSQRYMQLKRTMV